MAENDKQSNLLVQSAREFSDDECMMMASSLAYYTIFSLPPLLVIVITVAGWIWGVQPVQEAIDKQVESVVGAQGKDQIHAMVEKANDPKRGTIATIVGVVILLFGATGVVAQLQFALNRVWEVEPDPEQGGIKRFVMKRILSLGMILGLAFLLLVSLALTTALSAGVGAVMALLPNEASPTVLMVVNGVVSFVVFALLFAAMFKWLPDVKIAWKDVLFGAIVTAVLFMVGKFLIGLYIGRMDPGAYGAAGSLVLILVWVYYSGLILFFGAELTEVWARRHGTEIVPAQGAVKVVEEKRHMRGGQQRPAHGAM